MRAFFSEIIRIPNGKSGGKLELTELVSRTNSDPHAETTPRGPAPPQSSFLVEMKLRYPSWPLGGTFRPCTWLHTPLKSNRKTCLTFKKKKKKECLLLWVKFDDRLNAPSSMSWFSFSCSCPFVDLSTCDSRGCRNHTARDLSSRLIDRETGLFCSQDTKYATQT